MVVLGILVVITIAATFAAAVAKQADEAQALRPAAFHFQVSDAAAVAGNSLRGHKVDHERWVAYLHYIQVHPEQRAEIAQMIGVAAADLPKK
ncbi:MAG: hypothetical protein PHW95_01655 [Patescibacteria group bacterium]|nr:hypothetical protein [Patescibacteria group bacterium]